MTLKSNLMVLTIIFLLSISVTNCSDETEEETLVGTWVLTSMKYIYMGVSIPVDPNEFGLSSWIITLKDDNTYTQSITINDEITTVDGEWATSGKQLSFTTVETTSEYDYSLKGDKLELSGEIIFNETPFSGTLVFTRE